MELPRSEKYKFHQLICLVYFSGSLLISSNISEVVLSLFDGWNDLLNCLCMYLLLWLVSNSYIISFTLRVSQFLTMQMLKSCISKSVAFFQMYPILKICRDLNGLEFCEELIGGLIEKKFQFLFCQAVLQISVKGLMKFLKLSTLADQNKSHRTISDIITP